MEFALSACLFCVCVCVCVCLRIGTTRACSLEERRARRRERLKMWKERRALVEQDPRADGWGGEKGAGTGRGSPSGGGHQSSGVERRAAQAVQRERAGRQQKPSWKAVILSMKQEVRPRFRRRCILTPEKTSDSIPFPTQPQPHASMFVSPGRPDFLPSSSQTQEMVPIPPNPL